MEKEEIFIEGKAFATDLFYRGSYGNYEFIIADRENEELTIEWEGELPENVEEIEALILEEFKNR